MKNFNTKKFLLLFSFLFLPLFFTNAQVQRNPVIEACTGTWCQWCPCGHDIIDNILLTMPNAIAIEYHGPAGSSDPWDGFNGNQIISLLGYTGYPTGVVDRTGAPLSGSSWPGVVSTRSNIPAAVDIYIDKSYDTLSGELNVTIHSEAQQDLTGEYKLSFIILESGLIYVQTGNGSCPGGANYIHNHVVRSMINGAQGETLNGANPWNEGEIISKDIQFTVPAEYVAENCELVAFVYKVASPLYNGEIQQGEKWSLIPPDYAAKLRSVSKDVMTTASNPAEFTISFRNEGGLPDVYYINGSIDGPIEWTGEYTTTNGTFTFDQVDSLEVPINTTVEIPVTVNPNGLGGFAKISLQFTSKNDPTVIVHGTARAVTTTGVDFLVVDASGRNFGLSIDSSLARVADTASYGIITRKALATELADLSNYYLVAWSAGNKTPVFTTDELALLQEFLDQDGRLLINGQDIGADIFEPTGQSHFASGFYNNYLRAAYEANAGPSFFITGIAGDPIGDQLAFPLNNKYLKSPEKIAPFDAAATGILQFGTGPTLVGLKTETADFRVVYLGFGIEQIDDTAIIDSLVSRSITWLMEGVVTEVRENSSLNAYNYSLSRNYPNPFNPQTTISYSIAEPGFVAIKVYDILGNEVATIFSNFQQPGNYNVTFDASSLSSGMYIYKITAGNFTASRKMIILK